MFDIVGSLPLELLAYVVKYLGPADIFQSRRVSKRWRTMFSSDTVMTAILRETFAFLEGLDPVGISVTNVAIDDAMKFLRWRHALEHVRPVKTTFLPWPIHRIKGFPTLRYHSRRLCYPLIDDDKTQLETINLETGERSIRDVSELGKLVCFALSDDYLVVKTMQDGEHCTWRLTAWDMYTGKRLSHQLPDSGCRMFIFEDKVLIARDSKRRFYTRDTPIYVWELSANQVQEIGSFFNLILCHIDAVDDTLVALDLNVDEWPPLVHQTKWRTTTRQLLDEKNFRLPVPVEPPVDAQEFDVDSWNTFGHRTVTQLFFDATHKYPTLHLEYDYLIDRLSVRLIQCAEPFSGSAPTFSGSGYMSPNLVYHYTDQLAIYNANTGAVTLHQVWSHVSESKVVIARVFGDRDVFGIADWSGILLWVFNPTFVPMDIPECDCDECERLRQRIDSCNEDIDDF